MDAIDFLLPVLLQIVIIGGVVRMLRYLEAQELVDTWKDYSEPRRDADGKFIADEESAG